MFLACGWQVLVAVLPLAPVVDALPATGPGLPPMVAGASPSVQPWSQDSSAPPAGAPPSTGILPTAQPPSLSPSAARGSALAPAFLAPQLNVPTPDGARLDASQLGEVRQLIADGRFSQAEGLLRPYLAGHADSAAAHTLLAYCLLHENRPLEALPEYTSAARIEPPSAEDLKNVARTYVLLNDYTSAGHWAQVAVEKAASDPEAWYTLGRIRYTQQLFPEAETCFRKALALSPRSIKAENNLGLALEGLNRSDEAVEAYQTAIAWEVPPGNDPNLPQQPGAEQPLVNLAIVLVHRGDVDGALPLLVRAAAIAPRDARIREQLGHVYLQKEDLAAAQSELEQAVALKPGSSALHFLLGQTYRRRGLGAKAQAEFDRAAAILGTHSSQD